MSSIHRSSSLVAGGLTVLAAMLACSSGGDDGLGGSAGDAATSSGSSSGSRGGTSASSGGSSGSGGGVGSSSGSSSGAGTGPDAGQPDSGLGLEAGDGGADDGAADLDGMAGEDAVLDDVIPSDAATDGAAEATGSGMCPSPPIVSCFFAGQRYCIDYTGSNASGIASCPGGAVFSTSPCSAVDPGLTLLASCDVSAGASEYVVRYYSPYTQATAQTACSTLVGTLCQ